MNTATRDLENDHVNILNLISVMEHITSRDNPDVTHLEEIVSIIKNFADGVHHAKEEDILFPLLEQRGFSKASGPVAVMLHEHEAGRNFVRGINEGIDGYRNGKTGSLDQVYSNMNGYCELLKAHIARENNVLFRMADRVLSEKDHEDLLQKFSIVQKKQPTAFFEKRIAALAEIYNI